MNIAWSYGVNFMEQNNDGTWKATFNSDGMVNALQYVKDLKWKYNALPDNSVIDNDELIKLFATNQAAIIITSDPSTITVKYGTDVSNIGMAKLPEGPAGRYAQLGCDLRIINVNAFDEQIEACINWLDLAGYNARLDKSDEARKNTEENYQIKLDKNYIITGKSALLVWVDEEKIAYESEVVSKFVNVDLNDYNDYYDGEGVELRAEEPVCCQELYSVIDGLIQEVITNENADVKALVEKVNSDFQQNYLDKQ